MRKITMHHILLLLSAVSILYFIGIAVFTGMGSKFNYIWLFMGVFFPVLDFLYQRNVFHMVPVVIRRILLLCIALGALLFVIVECCIISGFFAKGGEDADYIIVLGAQMKDGGPSRSLRKRLDKAIDYAESNKSAMLVVSGGKGVDEPVSEAQGMYDYLISHGMDADRIIMEDNSTNTVENLVFTAKLIDVKQSRIGIVSNNFHIFRAVQIAKKQGYADVYGIAAPSEPFLQPANMTREFFGVMKDFLFGNM